MEEVVPISLDKRLDEALERLEVAETMLERLDTGTNHPYLQFINKKIDENELMIREKAQLLTVHETKFKQMTEFLNLPVSEGRHSLLEGLRENLRPLIEQSAEDIAHRVCQEQGKKFVTLDDFKVH